MTFVLHSTNSTKNREHSLNYKVRFEELQKRERRLVAVSSTTVGLQDKIYSYLNRILDIGRGSTTDSAARKDELFLRLQQSKYGPFVTKADIDSVIFPKPNANTNVLAPRVAPRIDLHALALIIAKEINRTNRTYIAMQNFQRTSVG